MNKTDARTDGQKKPEQYPSAKRGEIKTKFGINGSLTKQKEIFYNYYYYIFHMFTKTMGHNSEKRPNHDNI